MKRILYYCFAAILIIIIQSCAAPSPIRISVQMPPALYLPDNIEAVGVVNRSLVSPDQGNKIGNVIEGVITGEGIMEDKNGSISCVQGAVSQFNADGLVQAKNLDTVRIYGGTGTNVMPAMLSWNEVGTICKENGVDALVVLEVFDTDQQGSVSGQGVRKVIDIAVTGDVGVVPRPNTYSRVFVKTAWRFYDPNSQQVIDETWLNDYFGVNSATGISIFDLGEFRKRNAIQQSGAGAGATYARRLFPSWIWVQRYYYKRKGSRLRAARRMVEVNDWEGAMQIWQQIPGNENRIRSGRACYNLALGYEMEGDIETAIEWAQKAYTMYRIKKARWYVRELKLRQNSGL